MRLLVFLLLIAAGTAAAAQSATKLFSGRVLDEAGSPVEAVTVQVKGSRTVVITGRDGRFTINIPAAPATLVFSAVGFRDYETKLSAAQLSRTNFEIVLLRLHPAELDEVVVTAAFATSEKSYGAAAAVYGAAPGIMATGTPVRTRGMKSVAIPGTPAKPVYRDEESPETETAATPGILTAGEVNDFKKWKMWADYNAAEFKEYSQRWGVSAVNRYSVQLYNRSYAALVNRAVYLLDGRGDTIWKARTDNTGKAELWAGMNEEQGSQFRIAVDGSDRKFAASAFASGVNQVQLDQDCSLSDKVQVSFVVDATGSMSDEIGFLKQELEDVMGKIIERNKGISLELSSVFYRDHGDQYLTRHIGFSEELLPVANFVKLQSAGGGGDYPEAVNEALRTAMDSLNWDPGARSRILFLVLDAPPHDAARAEMIVLMQQAAAKGIRIVPIACSGTDKSTEFLMRSMALATNGSYIFLTDDSGVGGAHIKPTTDSYKVEKLNELLQRVITEMIFAMPCAGQNDHTTAPVDNTITQNNGVKIYPNPSAGRFTVSFKSAVNEIFITDFTGKILLRVEAGGKQEKFSVDLSGFPSATYLVRYFDQAKGWRSERVVIAR
ncbi:MAG TPA: carboxypeptidase-like regulatory domain-containing protein [Chitinophagaceae bacterium]